MTYRPSVGEMGNFPKFISKAIEEHGTDKGGILIIPPSNHQILLVPMFVGETGPMLDTVPSWTVSYNIGKIALKF